VQEGFLRLVQYVAHFALVFQNNANIAQTRPHGGAAANTSPVSWKAFPQSNGARAHPESNNKAHNILPWARCRRRDYRRG
jgi:hypothetical protein